MRKIFCYSGTGNSLASAKILAEEFGAAIVHITAELVESAPQVEGEMCIIIFPVYGYGLPMLVKRFLRASRFSRETDIIVLSTIGSKHGGAIAEAIRMVRRRGGRVRYSWGIKAVENYVHMFRLPPEERLKVICERQREKTYAVAKNIRDGKRNRRFPFRPESAFVRFVFRRASRVFARRYKFTDACNGCGVCYRVCPPLAIDMVERKPKVMPKKCDHCQACMQLCPARAIHFGRVTPEGRRYLHQDIGVKELMRRELPVMEKAESETVR
ncbi:MAG: EFR1 family ferrodoxin [Firmicutes bacterium]|nr:EFR1 family ferrodoxin [Bacillota bacterium]